MSLKVLHIGILSSPNLAIGRAFRESGHELVEINWAAHGSNLKHKVLSAANEMKPDLVFMQLQAPNIIQADTCDQLRSMGAFVANWSGDVRENIQWFKDLAPHVDVTSFTNLPDVEAIRATGNRAEYLQIGIDEHIYNPGIREQVRAGIVFMGNNYKGQFPKSKERADMVARMQKEFGRRFAVHGSGWPGVKALNPQQEADAYRNALVAIGMDHFTRPMFASDRLLRSTACGCHVMQQHYPGIEIEHPGTVTVWHTVDELILHCKGSSVSESLELGRRASEHTLANHRWHNRIKQLEAWITGS